MLFPHYVKDNQSIYFQKVCPETSILVSGMSVFFCVCAYKSSITTINEIQTKENFEILSNAPLFRVQGMPVLLQVKNNEYKTK